VVRVFKLRLCKKLPKKACLNFHIGLCTAPCIGNVNSEQYSGQVERARTFLKGNYQQTTEQLKSGMNTASREQKYELARELRNQIASIELLNHRQNVDTEKRFDQDIMAFRRLGEKMLIVQMGVRKGVLLGKKQFSIDLQPNVEQEFLKAFYASNPIPREILLNKPCWLENNEKTILEEFLSNQRQAKVTLTIPNRGNKFSLAKLAVKNIESNLSEDSALVDLQTALHLPTLPHIIECFDISNLGREHIVSGMTRFTDGKPDKRNYRKFKIRTLTEQDDPASINEVVTRRYKRLIEEKTPMPDLIVIDGGPGQINAAKRALKSLGLQLPLIALAKKNEEIYLPDEPTPRRFEKTSRMMLLLQRIRDETHNFSISYNRKRRQMKMKDQFKTK